MNIVNITEQIEALHDDLSRSSFKDVNFTNSQFSNVNLSGVQFESASFAGAAAQCDLHGHADSGR